MPTNIGILKFMTRLDDIVCCSEQENFLICIFYIMKISNFMFIILTVEHKKSLTNSGPELNSLRVFLQNITVFDNKITIFSNVLFSKANVFVNRLI